MSNFSKKLETSFKFKILICFVLSSLVIFSSLLINKLIDIRKSHKYIIEEDFRLINEVENIIIDHDVLKLEGYAFMLEKNSSNSKISLLLRDIINGNEIWMNVKKEKRPDINTYYKCEYDYEDTGFIAMVKSNKIDFNNYYEIIVILDIEENGYKVRKSVSTNKYIFNNTIIDFNPLEFDIPDKNIKSELLKKVFNDGKLCFYNKDAGLYVYQYDGKLFWIANENFQFLESGKTVIPCFIYTSQINNLPENRIEHKHDSIGFKFEMNEYTEENTSPYRVAIRQIPESYPITYIRTGVYDEENNKWLWEKYFHISIIER